MISASQRVGFIFHIENGSHALHLKRTCYIFISVLLFHSLNDSIKNLAQGFPCGAVVESLPANAGDTGSSPGLGGSHMPRSN